MRTAARPIPPITAAVEAKLFANIEKRPDGIWAWTKKRKSPAQAMIWIAGQSYYANRVIWVWNQRRENPSYQIPNGMDVCHRNDVTIELYDCCPANLWLGSHKENMHDRERKGRGNHDLRIAMDNLSKIDIENVRRGDKHPARLMPGRVAKGERAGHAKLKWNQVHEIRSLHSAGGLRYKDIAARFGVTWYTIRDIVTRKTWRTESGNAFSEKRPDPC